MYERTAVSRYPLQSALGHLGLALIQADRGETPSHATIAADKADAIGCELILARSRELLTRPQSGDASRQIFFC